jgi:hypothetical protein
MAVAEGRRWVREQGWDPLRLPDRAFEYAGIRVEVSFCQIILQLIEALQSFTNP